MEITYLGHSCFKIKGKNASLVTDPFANSVGLGLPSLSADVVTVSHDHFDHNAIEKISGTSRREKPYVISAPGEYEVNGIGVFGWRTYHDQKNGEERGKNNVFAIHVDGVRIVHLGDLGHTLDDTTIDGLGGVDVLLVPVGGTYTLNPEMASKVIDQLQPAFVIPMHYKTEKHDVSKFGDLLGLDAFLKVMGKEGLLPIEKFKLLGEMEDTGETEVVVLETFK